MNRRVDRRKGRVTPKKGSATRIIADSLLLLLLATELQPRVRPVQTPKTVKQAEIGARSDLTRAKAFY